MSEGQLTYEGMLAGFAEMERQEQLSRQRNVEFGAALARVLNQIGPTDTEAFVAAVRLVTSGFYPYQAALHPEEYERCMKILGDRGIDVTA